MTDSELVREAFLEAKKGYDEGDPMVVLATLMPSFDVLRADSRWAALRK